MQERLPPSLPLDDFITSNFEIQCGLFLHKFKLSPLKLFGESYTSECKYSALCSPCPQVSGILIYILFPEKKKEKKKSNKNRHVRLVTKSVFLLYLISLWSVNVIYANVDVR